MPNTGKTIPRMAAVIDPPFIGVLDLESSRIRFSPKDIDRIDRNRPPEIEDYPLGMAMIGLACVWLAQIGIALPKGLEIPIIKSRVTIIIRLIQRVATPW